MTQGQLIAIGGFVGLLVLVFQILQGKRIIKFKGPLHMKVHKAVAAVLLLISIGHAIAALVILDLI